MKNKKVLMLCTGGTIGMLHKDANDPSSPLVPASWQSIRQNFPSMHQLSFDIEAEEMELIDSSDMHPDYWINIARKIRDVYTNYDGFVILHGTDTMAYTATALSFLFENLNKPVIITGSQLPLAEARNDAAYNLVTALKIAASDGVPTVPEVCILFNNVLLRGNRSRKVSSSSFAGFNSLNYRPLAEIGEHIKIETKLLRTFSTEGFFINEFLDSNVMVFDIFPGISPEILRHVFNIEGLKGLILRTYGTGNAPTTNAFLKEIEYAINVKNLAIVNVTQCVQGMVEMGLYEASSQLAHIGVISGVDMTPEAALVKMMFLLGQGYDIPTVKEYMQKDLRGEQSVNVFNFIYDWGNTERKICRLMPQSLPAGFMKGKIVKANIRFNAVDVKDTKEYEQKILKLAIFMNYLSADTNTPTNIPQCLGVIERRYYSKETDCMLECTQTLSQVINPGRPVQLTVVSLNKDVSWNGVILAIYTDAID